MRIVSALLTAVLLSFLSACQSGDSAGPLPPSVPAIAQAVELPPLPPASDFVAVVDNPFYPLIPGTIFEYRSETDAGIETNTVEVTHDAKTILGIAATVVHDQVFLDGELTEDTFDWFAQDRQGNVWYLGEHSCEVVDGECVSTEGSWEAGVDGAEAGIIMWANPGAHEGKAYRQEFLEGVAEDEAKVLNLDADVAVPFGEFSGCLETMDFSSLEPGVREHKFYSPGTGLLLEMQPRGGQIKNELVSITQP